MECGARAMRKFTRPASRTSEPGSHTLMTRHLGVGGITTVMGTFSLGSYQAGATAPPMMIPSGYP